MSPWGAEGAVYDASLSSLALRMRCEYDVGAGMTRSLLIGPSIAATLAWSALVALLAGLRHVNRGATVLVDPEPVVSRPKVADLLAR